LRDEPREHRVGPSSPFVGWVGSYPRATALEVETHAGFEVGLVFGGQFERHCQDFAATLGPGDVWLNAAWEPHAWRVTAAGTRLAVFLFAPEFIADQVFESPWYLSLFSAPPRERPRVTTPEMRREMLLIGQRLAREAKERRRGWRAAAQLELLRLLHALRRDWEPTHHSDRERGVPVGNFSRIMPAADLVYSAHGMARRISLAEASSTCNLSVSQFRFMFHHTMGLTFGKFCLRARLAFASHLLLTADLSVDAIARRAGFTDGSHLHRMFVKYYGSTPATYRQHRLLRPEVREVGNARGR